ncbi:MAG: YbaB/EbfC family nucleoid-associated protein [Planctomycetes bacterium]|nr:YbaB/EbfC family nucleoid-associated protein [Planctomycetota bacterium]
MFKGLGNLSSLLKQAHEISGRMKGLNSELRLLRATGSAGGGMVEIEVNGLMEVLRCHIDQQLVEQGDREMIEDLVSAAVGQAIAKGKELHVEAMKSMAGGLEIPGLESALGDFLGNNDTDESS